MSYFATATQGINASVGLREQTKRIFRGACTAWIELTDFGYELSTLSEVHFISFSRGAVEEQDTALRHGHARGFPDSLEIMPSTDGVRGVIMANLVRRARVALKSL